MYTICKHCGSDDLVKNGYVNKKQRYLCRSCDKTFRVGDNREKYTMEQKIRVIKLYTENMGIRSIERLEKVPGSLLVHWIRNFGKIIRAKLCSTEIPENVKEIEILEVDELFTYIKKTQQGLCVACCGQKQESSY